ncbi:hypothetical protein HYU07_05130 [Candidatus Woesearchaeota archaeon]|nr:hypothetical protein [Candidatus Woesearchaeota archaeon]
MGLVATQTVDDVVLATEEQKKQCASGEGKDYSICHGNGMIKCCEVGGCEKYRGIAKTRLVSNGIYIEKTGCTKPTD